MRTSERMRYLKRWVEKELCEGRMMKAPAPGMNIGEIVRQEPRCYLAWAPTRLDQTGRLREDPISVVPGIIIMPNQSYAKNMEEHRIDRYSNINRPKELGAQLSVSMLFSVYEPGIRLSGFIDSVGPEGQGLNMALIQEGTEEGLFTLTNWMDDCMTRLLGQKTIPYTDLAVTESTMTYGLYTDQSYVVDKRPVYYGFVNVVFGCYAEETPSNQIKDLLL